jgi:hypothetical protein
MIAFFDMKKIYMGTPSIIKRDLCRFSYFKKTSNYILMNNFFQKSNVNYFKIKYIAKLKLNKIDLSYSNFTHKNQFTIIDPHLEPIPLHKPGKSKIEYLKISRFSI